MPQPLTGKILQTRYLAPVRLGVQRSRAVQSSTNDNFLRKVRCHISLWILYFDRDVKPLPLGRVWIRGLAVWRTNLAGS